MASVVTLVAALALSAACTSTRTPAPQRPAPDVISNSLLDHLPLDGAAVSIEPGPRTAEDNWFLDLYTFLHNKDFTPLRVVLPPSESDGEEAIAHLVLPDGDQPQPVVIVLPILGGDHFVSEAFAKALVNRGRTADALEELGWLVVEVRKTGGRPTTVCHPNPAVWEMAE